MAVRPRMPNDAATVTRSRSSTSNTRATEGLHPRRRTETRRRCTDASGVQQGEGWVKNGAHVVQTSCSTLPPSMNWG